MDQSQRPIFFEGQYLGADDLTAAVLYEHVQTARHTLGAHTWGISIGLDLYELALPSGAVDVSILPGVAWDGYGNAVVVTSPAKIPIDPFNNFPYDTPDDGALVKIWLRYKEAATATTPLGFALCCEDTSNRIAESYAIVVGEPSKGSHDEITVAGRSVKPDEALQLFNPDGNTLYDESVPFQQFPETGDKRRWLIPVGMVRWFKQGSQPGMFLPRDDKNHNDSDTIRAFRQYIGVVAESLQAADGVIRLRNRSNDPTKVHFHPPRINGENDLVWVEGNLRVLGDTRLIDGALEFRTSPGDRDAVPQVVRRVEDNGAGGKDLQVLFADKNTATANGNNAFVVGNVNMDGTTGALKEIAPFLTVRDNGLTCIGGKTKPAASLHVAGDLAIDKKIVGGSNRNLQNSATLIWNDGQWLWLNANLDNSAPIPGVRTPGEFACGSLNVGGVGGNWGDPGNGSAWFAGSLGIGTTSLGASLTIQGPNKNQGTLSIFGSGGDFVYDGGDDHLFVFRNTGNVTALMGGLFGINTFSPNAQLHVTDNLQVDNGAVINGSLAISGNPTPNPVVSVHSNNAVQGNISLFSGDADFEYDGGNDGVFVFKNTATTAVTSFIGGSFGFGTTTPSYLLQVAGDAYVEGALYATWKPFAIPHPKNKNGQWLIHCAIEGPEAAVYYRGESCLSKGVATITLPDYFESLTSPEQRTVQLTPLYEGDEPISTLACSAVRSGCFNVRMITPDNPSQRFYWEVKAVRADLPPLQVERPADGSFRRS